MLLHKITKTKLVVQYKSYDFGLELLIQHEEKIQATSVYEFRFIKDSRNINQV